MPSAAADLVPKARPKANLQKQKRASRAHLVYRVIGLRASKLGVWGPGNDDPEEALNVIRSLLVCLNKRV